MTPVLGLSGLLSTYWNDPPIRADTRWKVLTGDPSQQLATED